jgi:ABC-2 type transport system permease protein
MVLSALMYDRDLLVRSVFMVVVLIVFVNLWAAAYAATGQASIEGYSLSDIVWYMVITESIIISKPNVAVVIDGEVRAGDVAYRLSRPYSYPLYHLASYLGEAVVRLPVSIVAGTIVAWIAVGPPPVSIQSVVALVVSMGCALTLQGIIEVLVGLCAFWVEDTMPILWIWNKFALTLGGVLLPLELFPDWLAAIARALPFAAVAYAPGRLFVGFDWSIAASVILTQAVWIGLCWLTVALLFGRATRRVVAHGG